MGSLLAGRGLASHLLKRHGADIRPACSGTAGRNAVARLGRQLLLHGRVDLGRVGRGVEHRVELDWLGDDRLARAVGAHRRHLLFVGAVDQDSDGQPAAADDTEVRLRGFKHEGDPLAFGTTPAEWMSDITHWRVSTSLATRTTKCPYNVAPHL